MVAGRVRRFRIIFAVQVRNDLHLGGSKDDDQCSVNDRLSQEEPQSTRRHITSDAKLGLERLIVGRECNAFDRLPAERKALAFVELIDLGLIKGVRKEVPGRAYPDVTVQHVTSAGRKAFRKKDRREGSEGKPGGWKFGILSLFFVAVVLAVLAVLHSCKS
jgi:hypothetical protein